MSANKKNRNKGEKINIRWMLVLYDLMIYAVVTAGLLILYNGVDKLDTAGILQTSSWRTGRLLCQRNGENLPDGNPGGNCIH